MPHSHPHPLLTLTLTLTLTATLTLTLTVALPLPLTLIHKGFHRQQLVAHRPAPVMASHHGDTHARAHKR